MLIDTCNPDLHSFEIRHGAYQILGMCGVHGWVIIRQTSVKFRPEMKAYLLDFWMESKLDNSHPAFMPASFYAR